MRLSAMTQQDTGCSDDPWEVREETNSVFSAIEAETKVVLGVSENSA